MTIKAIETEYNGYRFRSRLEARWAVFFDAAGIKYEYESEGYELDKSTRYLPDFYLPDFDCYVEVKRDTEDGIQEIEDKCFKAIKWGGPIKQILILSNIPKPSSPDGGIWHFPVLYWKANSVVRGWWFFYDAWHSDIPIVEGHVTRCDYPVDYNSIRAVSDYELSKRSWIYRNRIKGVNEKNCIVEQELLNDRFFTALKAAYQARFEHGETPTKEGIA